MGKYHSGCSVGINWKMVKTEAGKSMGNSVMTETMNRGRQLMGEEREADSRVGQ